LSGNRLRIIGGSHRSRVLTFPALPGLRPTPDRVRETLFNWLGQRVEGLRCLDLYAGSGALGFEAASRGAGTVVMVEKDPRAVRALERNAAALGLGQAVVIVGGDGLAYLTGGCGQFDVIFLDPPFASDLLDRSLAVSATHLAPGGKIYAEFGTQPDLTQWHVLREGRAGRSRFCLLELA
jgi:16S rRNA (guanine966-N2)-methyltransferase